jgi:hypothetical protein
MKFWKSKRTGQILIQRGEHFAWLDTGAPCYSAPNPEIWVECVLVEKT